jgi:hypothetical protein
MSSQCRVLLLALSLSFTAAHEESRLLTLSVTPEACPRGLSNLTDVLESFEKFRKVYRPSRGSKLTPGQIRSDCPLHMTLDPRFLNGGLRQELSPPIVHNGAT